MFAFEAGVCIVGKANCGVPHAPSKLVYLVLLPETSRRLFPISQRNSLGGGDVNS